MAGGMKDWNDISVIPLLLLHMKVELDTSPCWYHGSLSRLLTSISHLSPLCTGLSGSEGGPGAAASLHHRGQAHDQQPHWDLDHREREEQPAWGVSGQ